MDGMPHDSQAPQLRTLLLTDLCDSTVLVEKLGDGPAAALFRDHDRLVLELQQKPMQHYFQKHLAGYIQSIFLPNHF